MLTEARKGDVRDICVRPEQYLRSRKDKRLQVPEVLTQTSREEADMADQERSCRRQLTFSWRSKDGLRISACDEHGEGRRDLVLWGVTAIGSMAMAKVRTGGITTAPEGLRHTPKKLTQGWYVQTFFL